MYIAAAAPGLGAVSPAALRSRVVYATPPARKRLFVMPGRGRGFGAILQPSAGTVQSSMINWSGSPVTVPDAASYLSQMVSSLENDVRYKLESGGTILDPNACAAKLQGELASQCSIYPGTCAGVDAASLAANLCGHYSDYLSQQQASLGNPQTNYVAPVQSYPIYNEGQAVQYFTPAPTPTSPQPGAGSSSPAVSSAVVTAPKPVSSSPAPAVTQYSAATPQQTGGGVQTMQAPYPSSAAPAAVASGFSLDSLPSWALPAAIAAGVALFMFGGKR